MAKNLAILLAVAPTAASLLLSACAPPEGREPFTNWAARREIPFQELRDSFPQPDKAYAPFAFWFWDAPIDADQISAMAAEMCRQGLNPGYAQGRSGLPRDQWLSDLWFEALDAAAKKAEANGAYLGYCDEYNWPSGQVAGRIIEKNPQFQAESLKWETRDVEGGREEKLPESFFTVAAELDGSGRIRSTSLRVIGAGGEFTWQPSESKWRVFSFTKFHHAGLDGSPVGYLQDRLAETVIAEAYEPYVKSLGDRLGKSIPGVFVDHEGDYGWKLAWSENLARIYRERTGRDIRLWMPLLLERDAEGIWAKARWDWFDIVSDIYAQGFFGKLSRWAEAHGMYLTAHVWEESLQLQAESVGDFFKVQRALTMPGTDSLVSKSLEVVEFKETQSVSEFEGRRFMSEILGVAGWRMTPVLMKQALNAVTAWGVSHVVPHGVFVNRELNAIPYPPDFFTENPYWPYLHLWTDFARRASYVNSQGHAVPDVLVVCPIDSVWALAGEWLFATKDEGVRQVEAYNRAYHEAITLLTAARIEYLIADRHYLGQMVVTPDGRLVIGEFGFRTVVLPPTRILPLALVEKILVFARNGGSVCFLGELPEGSTERGMGDAAVQAFVKELKALPSVVQVQDGLAAELARKETRLPPHVRFESGEFPMLQLRRRISGRDFFWLANNTQKRQDSRLFFDGIQGAASIWDCETGDIRAVSVEKRAEGTALRISFRPLEGFWLVFDPKAEPVLQTAEPTEPSERPIHLDGPWRVRIARDGQPSLTAGVVKFLAVPWKAPWLKVTGRVAFRHEFDLAAAPERAQVKITADDSFRLWVNGRALPHRSWDDLWRQVSVLDLTRHLRKGRNVIAVSARKNVEAKGGGQKDGDHGGLILEGEVALPGGDVVPLRTGGDWRMSGEPGQAPAPAFGKWIWGPRAASDQKVHFRKSFSVREGSAVRFASLAIAVDNRFVLHMNGKRVGSGDNWNEPSTYDVADYLRPGRNVIGVEGRNDAGQAGLLAGLIVRYADGTRLQVLSDESWLWSQTAGDGWQDLAFADTNWAAAMAICDYGGAPWGRFEEDRLLEIPEWTSVEFSSASWPTAEVLGLPPLAPWIDVPLELLEEKGAEKPLENWLNWGLSRFSGHVDYTKTFEWKPVEGARVVLDLGEVKHMARADVNGRMVGERLWPPFEFDVTSALVAGTNTVTVRVGNLIVNEMAQFDDKKMLGTWGWGYRDGQYSWSLPTPGEEELGAGLLGPVVLRVVAEAK